MFEQGPLLIVRCHKFNRRVIVWQAAPPGIDVLSVILWHNREVFVALINAHHVFHRVCMRLGQRSKTVPVRDDAYVHQVVHQARQLNVIFQDAWWILKRIVVVICPVFFSELLEELVER